jgi:hypothetical protein
VPTVGEGKNRDELSPVHSAGEADRALASAGAPLAGKRRPAHHKTGIDANRPIDPGTGRIEPQVADPDIVAATSAGWVRLNFILGPWSGPDDDSLHEGRTWAETYEQIITGFGERGLRIYGLIGAEAMPEGPGDRFRAPPLAGDVYDDWLHRYVACFVRIVQMFHADVGVFESFNEPDDWHGQQSSWVHPRWFAIMLQRIYTAVRSEPELERVKLVSGPLQGLESNRNAAVHYLQEVYRAGKEWFGWGRGGRPFPFDGIGYHIYVKGDYNPNRPARERAIRTLCRRYLGAMHQVVRQQEGQDRPVFVSEMGWNSRVEPREYQLREEFQASCMRAGLATVCSDPLVELAVWFCVQDFSTQTKDMHFGLYRSGGLAPGRRKPAFHTFQAFCEGEIEEGEERPRYTNQHVINAFYRAAVHLGRANRWGLLTKAGLSLRKLAANRHGVYDGPPIGELPNLTNAERALVQAKLDAQVPRARAAARPRTSYDSAAQAQSAMDDLLDPDLSLDLSVALQDDFLRELARHNDLLARGLDEGTGPEAAGAGLKRVLLRFGLVWLLVALTVAALAIVVARVLLP